MAEEELAEGQYKTHYLNAKPTTDLFTLPCGYLDEDGVVHQAIQLKEMTGVEEEILAGAGGSVGGKFDKVIANCLVSLGEVPRPGLKHVKSLTVVDRIFLIIALRRVSLGDDYRIEASCAHCGKSHPYTVDLGALAITRMEDPSKRSFDEVCPSGMPFTWHAMTGHDEEWLEQAGKKLKGNGAITLAMLARLDSLNGEELPKDPKNRRELIQSVDRLSKVGIRDRNHMRRVFGKREGDVDMEVEFDCASCDEQFSAAMRVDPKAFFFPSEM